MTAVLWGLVATTVVTSTATHVFELDNGLRVVLETDRRSPLTGVAVAYDVGSADDPGGRAGLAHLVEHLAFRRTAHLGELEIWERVEGSGGSLNAYTAPDRTVYQIEAPAARLEEWLWIESERMGFARVTEDDVEAEKKVVERELAERDGIYTRVVDRQSRVLYPADSRYHAPSNEKDQVGRMTVEDVGWFLRAHYGPVAAVLAVVSPYPHDRVEGWVRRYFDDLPAGPALGVEAEAVRTCASSSIRVRSSLRRRESSMRWYLPPRFTPAQLEVTRRYLENRIYRHLRKAELQPTVQGSVERLRVGYEFWLSVELPPDEVKQLLSKKLEAALDEALTEEVKAKRVGFARTRSELAKIRQWRSSLDRAEWLATEHLLGRPVGRWTGNVRAVTEADVSSVLKALRTSQHVDLHLEYDKKAKREKIDGLEACLP